MNKPIMTLADPADPSPSPDSARYDPGIPPPEPRTYTETLPLYPTPLPVVP
ncbi:hypothetical protein CIR78_004293 [Escherichia coli]|nr:hypothetical protein [Escherichia coli]EKL8349470.1 hypothetical protein [Escherichia coli]